MTDDERKALIAERTRRERDPSKFAETTTLLDLYRHAVDTASRVHVHEAPQEPPAGEQGIGPTPAAREAPGQQRAVQAVDAAGYVPPTFRLRARPSGREWVVAGGIRHPVVEGVLVAGQHVGTPGDGAAGDGLVEVGDAIAELVPEA